MFSAIFDTSYVCLSLREMFTQKEKSKFKFWILSYGRNVRNRPTLAGAIVGWDAAAIFIHKLKFHRDVDASPLRSLEKL